MAFLIEKQIESMWCWAAVSVSVDRYFTSQTALTQCSVASMVLGTDCCANPAPCNVPAALSDALVKVGHFKTKHSRAFTFQEVRNSIDAGFPVCVRIGWYNGGGHFVVIRGWRITSAGEELVSVADPLLKSDVILFDQLLYAYKYAGYWTTSYEVQ